MRIAVTGAGGFIGRHLIQRLQGEHSIVAISRTLPIGHFPSSSGVQLVRGDWSDPALIRTALEGVAAVIHLGGIKGKDACERDAREAIAVNVEGTLRLVVEARKAGVDRFLFASTYGVYGRRHRSELPSPEAQDLRPSDLYHLTKAWTERLVQQECPTSTILRLGHVYGSDPADSQPDVTMTFLRWAWEEGTLRVRGSGRISIDPIWIGDVCKGIHLLLQRMPMEREVFNVASGCPLTIRELAEAIRSHVQEIRGTPIRVLLEGPDDPEEFDRIPDVRRIREALQGFSPRPLHEGLKAISMEETRSLHS